MEETLYLFKRDQTFLTKLLIRKFVQVPHVDREGNFGDAIESFFRVNQDKRLINIQWFLATRFREKSGSVDRLLRLLSLSALGISKTATPW